jgi:sarcosine oxidase subunit beta
MPDADVVIIGGGVHGAALSYELSRAGTSVILLERTQLASGASGGMGLRGVRANDRDLRELPLMRIAYDIWPGLETELGRDAGFRGVGGLCLFESDTAQDPLVMARLRAMVTTQNAHGIPTDIISRERLEELEPGVSPDVVGAIYTPRDGTGDHNTATRAYAEAGQALGATVFENTTAVNITAAERGGEVRVRSGEVHRAGTAIVVLANYHTGALLAESFGLHFPLWRYNPQATPVRARNGFTPRHLIGHVTRVFSAKTIDGGVVMLTGGRSGFWDNDSDQGHPDPAVTACSTVDAHALFPELADAEVLPIDASRADSVSVDQIPIIDQVPGAPSVFFATGWSGHGFAIAPAVARLLSNWVRTRQRPVELAPFGLGRLAAPTAGSAYPSPVGAN